MKKIKAIVFDIGGVLCKQNKPNFSPKLDKLAERHNKNPLDFHTLRKKYAKLSVIGKISSNKFQKIILKELEISDKKRFIQKWKSIIKNDLKINKKVEYIVSRLSKKYLLATLTDITEMMDKPRIKKEVYKFFKINFRSYKIRFRKPNIKFYKLLMGRLRKMKIKPEETIFIDDHEKNLSPAKKIVWKTILFKSDKQLVRDLMKFGVCI